MEKRHAKRTESHLPCELISRSLKFTGYIEDFSEDGMCVFVNPARAVEDIPNGMTFVVKCKLHSGDTIDIQCRVRHAHKSSPEGLRNNIGMEIMDRPPEYKKFINALTKQGAPKRS